MHLVHVVDASTARPLLARAARLREAGVSVALGPDAMDSVGTVGCVVKSPGIPPDLPVLRAAASAGAPVLDELEIGWRLSRRPFVGVTGTNGKTTTTAMIAAALGGAEQAGNSQFHPALSTLPLQGGPVVCEVSSYQLESTASLVADLAVLTNVTRDHLHRHGTMAAYAAAKRRMFIRRGRAAGYAVVGTEQGWGRRLAEELATAGTRVMRVGAALPAEYVLFDAAPSRNGWRLRARTPDGPLELDGAAPGRHGALNTLTALAASRLIGIGTAVALRAITSMAPIPGRFESVDVGQPFKVVVDYAHTPDALRATLVAARAVTPGRLTAVLSVAGVHDPGKRPPMGATVQRLADRVIFTRGALYGEPVQSVLAGLVGGATAVGGQAPEIEPDRRAAIAAGLEGAVDGDTVAILGRGALPRMMDSPDGEGPLFDDRCVVRELLSELGFAPGLAERRFEARP